MVNIEADTVSKTVYKLVSSWSEGLNEASLQGLGLTKEQVQQTKERWKRLLQEDLSHEESLPMFIFEIQFDGTHLSPEPHKPFLCVYEFCVALEMFCKSKKLDIEKHWDRLLLKTSAHQVDRFMWIHTHLIHQPAVRLTWEQVVRRLMLQYDDPKRALSIQHSLRDFSFDDRHESIEQANRRFVAYVLESNSSQSLVVPIYLSGMPELCQKLLKLTLIHDTTSRFNYCLKDVVQRASVFIHAKDDDYVFYSKTARNAVALTIEKVTSKMCEFHLSSAHLTVECPDYSVLKYPYVDPMAIDSEFSLMLEQEAAQSPSHHTSPTLPTYLPTQTIGFTIKQEPNPDPVVSPPRTPIVPHTPFTHKPPYHHRSSLERSDQCIFCKLPFFPGHLNVCKKVAQRKKHKKEHPSIPHFSHSSSHHGTASQSYKK